MTIEWNEAQRICDLPAVDEALRGFSEDPTGDNGTCLVRAILEAASAAPQEQSPQARQESPQASAMPQIPEGYVLMPKQLTAENGAKAALMGEFHEPIVVVCPTCEGDTATEDCADCEGTGTAFQDIPIKWDTIKAIYKMAVETCAAPVASAALMPSERNAFEDAMRKLSNGEPDWESPASMWSWAAWQARAVLAAPVASAAPVEWTEKAALTVLNKTGDGPYGYADVIEALNFLRAAEAVRSQIAPVASAAPVAPVAPDLPKGCVMTNEVHLTKLQAVYDAVSNLVQVKGRFHTEQAYQRVMQAFSSDH